MSCAPCKEMPVLTERVTIERPGGTADAAGHIDLDDDDNWELVGTRKCRILTRSGREGYRFNQVQAEVTHIVEMRSDTVTRAIVPTYRLLFGDRVFAIAAAFDVDQQRQTVRCDCIEQV